MERMPPSVAVMAVGVGLNPATATRSARPRDGPLAGPLVSFLAGFHSVPRTALIITLIAIARTITLIATKAKDSALDGGFRRHRRHRADWLC